MAAKREDIQRWLKEAPEGATHMIVICDTFDWEDYPVYVTSAEDARDKANNPGNMAKTMEVYNLSMDHEQQLSQHRAWNY